MKKLLFLVTVVLYTTTQAQTYTLSVSTNTYTNLTGSTSLNNGVVWDDPAFTFPVGFNFQLYDTVFNTAYFHPDGLGGVVTTAPNAANTMPTLIPLGTDILDRGFVSGTSLSNISYKLEGPAGSRILKIEWNNVGFLGDVDLNGSSTDFANFQVWLYETTNIVEYRYGPSAITFPAESFEGQTGPSVALFPLVNFNTGQPTAGVVLSGSANTPSSANTTTQSYLVGMPSSGITYRFTPSNMSTNSFDKESTFQIYPNPASDNLTINNQNFNQQIEKVSILDYTGKIVETITSNFEKINIHRLQKGIYMVQINAENKSFYKKLIKI